MRRVTEIRPVTKTKSRVYLDGEFAFTLYRGELSRYRIASGSVLSEEEYQDIRENVVLKRAKRRAMHLLADMDRTESQLREKLLTGGYPEDLAERAMDYVKSFGYIDDERYARQFIAYKKQTRSRNEIQAQLMRKGLDRDLIRDALEECLGREDDREAIRRLLEKKNYCPETADWKERQKISAYLARKGFRYEDIRQVIQNSELDT